MRILALYLKEYIEKRVNGKKQVIATMPGTDRAICKYDVIFNLCDGLEDDNNFVEFSALTAIEKTKIPFTGNGLKTIRLCNDKRGIKKTLVKNNIPTANFQIFKKSTQKLRSDMKFPLIVKPVCADAAVGIYADSVVKNEKDLKKRITRVLKTHQQPAALVEEYIEGRDLIIPVMGKKKIKVLDPTELKYMRSYEKRPKILSYGAKWDKGKPIYKDCITLVKNPDKRFSKKDRARIDSIAKRVYKATGCSGYATIDARLDKNGNIFVIEINPNCWIGPKSDTALTLDKNKGIDYTSMISKIVKIALE